MTTYVCIQVRVPCELTLPSITRSNANRVHGARHPRFLSSDIGRSCHNPSDLLCRAISHLPIMPGFDFSNHNRNAALHAQGLPLPKATSTGTTIVGCIFDGGVVIAADTRATSGPIVADKVLPHLLLCSLKPKLTNVELRETALHCPPNMVCWCWYRSRHRIHHRPHLI